MDWEEMPLSDRMDQVLIIHNGTFIANGYITDICTPYFGNHFLLQQDNTQPHIAWIAQDYLPNSGIATMPCLANSSNLHWEYFIHAILKFTSKSEP